MFADSQLVTHSNNHTFGYSNNMDSDPQTKRLKKMGWYWGSISPEFAAKLLEHEKEGSFLVRDSSSPCYIYSMTFKLEGQVHHARIEHSNGKYRRWFSHLMPSISV